MASRIRQLGAGAVLGIALTLVLSGVASAHSLPQSSNPSAGAQLTTSPSQVSIIFGERPDPKLSTIKVLDTSGALVTSGPTSALPANPAELVVPLKADLPDGVYTVAWRTVSAVDGHLATGSFAFGIGVAPPASGSGSGSAGRPPGPRRPRSSRAGCSTSAWSACSAWPSSAPSWRPRRRARCGGSCRWPGSSPPWAPAWSSSSSLATPAWTCAMHSTHHSGRASSAGSCP